MTTHLDVAVRDYPHTLPLKRGSVGVHGCDVEYHEVSPIYKAFAPMVSEQTYDVCEMAIATVLQARAAGKPISLLPVVMSGNFHHHSLTRWPTSPAIDPTELRGKRVGVRAYSQTTGLWVRGVLREEFGVAASEVTWVTTEGAHVSDYREPSNVERTNEKLLHALRDGDVVAAVLGLIAIEDAAGESLVPVITNWRQAEAAWQERHRTIPINHMLVVRSDRLAAEPHVFRSMYRAVTQTMDEAVTAGEQTSKQRALRHGLTESVWRGVEVAVDYACEQEVIRTELDVDELFADFKKYIGE